MYLSENGSKVIFLGENWPQTDVGIDVISFTGGKIRTLLTPDQISHLEQFSDPFYGLGIWYFRWIPNTPKMLFTTGGYFGQSVGSTDNLFSLNVETGALKRLFALWSGGFSKPSPNGQLMTLTQCGSVKLASISGNILYKDVVTYDRLSNKCYYPETIWKTDSSSFGLLVKSQNETIVWTVDTSTGKTTDLAHLDREFEGYLSPTFTCVADIRIGTDNPEGFPYLVKIEGSSQIKVLKMGSSNFISFSPDGQHYAFYKNGDNTNASLYIGSLDGNIFRISEITIPHIFKWVNNLQFVFRNSNSIQLGDVGGNVTVITTSDTPFYNFDAVDISDQR